MSKFFLRLEIKIFNEIFHDQKNRKQFLADRLYFVIHEKIKSSWDIGYKNSALDVVKIMKESWDLINRSYHNQSVMIGSFQKIVNEFPDKKAFIRQIVQLINTLQTKSKKKLDTNLSRIELFEIIGMLDIFHS